MPRKPLEPGTPEADAAIAASLGEFIRNEVRKAFLGTLADWLLGIEGKSHIAALLNRESSRTHQIWFVRDNENRLDYHNSLDAPTTD